VDCSIDPWAEQISPEEIEDAIKEVEEAEREAERQAALEEKLRIDAEIRGDAPPPPEPKAKAAPGKPGDPAANAKGPLAAAQAMPLSHHAAPRVVPPGHFAGDNPAHMAIYAATLEEEDIPPFAELPPLWMRTAVVAPAPTLGCADPPLRVLEDQKARRTWQIQQARFDRAAEAGLPPKMNETR